MTSEQINSLPTKFVQDPSSHLLCPVCHNLYNDPVINVKCGHTFCRKCAFVGSHCPVDDSHIDTSQLVVNRLVVGQIEDLQIYCQHGLVKKNGVWELLKDSCQQIISFGKRGDHESTCQYALLPCPHSEACGTVRRRDLDKHRLECVQTPCPYKSKGCKYRNSQADILNHSKQCIFGENGTTNRILAQKIQEQDSLIKNLRNENSKLVSQVEKLEQSAAEMRAKQEKQESLLQNLQENFESLAPRFDHRNSFHGRRHMSSSELSLAETNSVSGNLVRSGSVAKTSSVNMNQEKWEMPFQFKCIGTLRGHQEVVWALTTRKGRLYSGGGDGVIKIWNLDQLAVGCVGNIKAHTGAIHCLTTWANTLISAGADKSICLWNLESGGQKSKIEAAHDNIICSMVIVEDMLFTSSFSVIKVWDLKTQELKTTLTGLNHWVRSLALNKNKDKLYSGSHNAINVWDAKDNFDQLATIEHQCGSVYSLVLTKTYIIAGTYNQNIQVFSVETHEFITHLCGHFGTVTTLVVSPSGRFLFSASHDSNIQMWGLEKLLPIQTMSRHQGSVNTLTLHGDFLLSGSEDHEIKVFRHFPTVQ